MRNYTRRASAEPAGGDTLRALVSGAIAAALFIVGLFAIGRFEGWNDVAFGLVFGAVVGVIDFVRSRRRSD